MRSHCMCLRMRPHILRAPRLRLPLLHLRRLRRHLCLRLRLCLPRLRLPRLRSRDQPLRRQ